MKDRIAAFLATVFSPANTDSSPEKLRQAVKLLQEVLDDSNRH